MFYVSNWIFSPYFLNNSLLFLFREKGIYKFSGFFPTANPIQTLNKEKIH